MQMQIADRKLILIKHARPAISEKTPSHEWELSEEGKAACGPLAEIVRAHDPAIIITSDEPKAIQTGKLLGERLGKPVEIASDLHEHDRSNVPMMRSAEFLSALADFFKQGSRLVLGKETANQAADRFSRAVDSIVESHAQGNIAIVTHGTVLALFAAQHGAGDPFGMYRSMGLPSMMVFTLPEFRFVEKLERVKMHEG